MQFVVVFKVHSTRKIVDFCLIYYCIRLQVYLRFRSSAEFTAQPVIGCGNYFFFFFQMPPLHFSYVKR